MRPQPRSPRESLFLYIAHTVSTEDNYLFWRRVKCSVTLWPWSVHGRRIARQSWSGKVGLARNGLYKRFTVSCAQDDATFREHSSIVPLVDGDRS